MNLFGFLRSAPVWRVDAAQMRHAAAIAQIHGQSFARGWSRGEIEGLIADPSVTADILCGGSAMGAADGFVLSRRAADEAEILSIAVAPAWRGKGASHGLLQRHMGRLMGQGIRRLFLEVDEANAPARALYAGCGFEEVGRRPAYYTRADGSRVTALILARDLD